MNTVRDRIPPGMRDLTPMGMRDLTPMDMRDLIPMATMKTIRGKENIVKERRNRVGTKLCRALLLMRTYLTEKTNR